MTQKSEATILRGKCTPSQMLKVVMRQIGTPKENFLPEQNLILAIIGGGISDLKEKRLRSAAVAFFAGELFGIY